MIYSVLDETVEGFTAPLTWTYAHGQLEGFLAYQDIMTDDLAIFKAYHDVVATRRSAKVETKAKNHNGDIISVDFYLWWNGTVRGLAVSIYDVESREYAEKKYNEEAPML